MKFEELIKNKEILDIIVEKGYVEPTKIQEQIIPLILDGNDVLGQSRTGTGKTLAFAASILTKINLGEKTQALIIAPTRELAIQITREIKELGKYTKIDVTCVYGSSSISEQISKLKKGTEIVVGTPGRVKDLINRRALKLDNIKFFVLDEADEMLSMGFQEDIEDIFSSIKGNKQVLMFSATMPKTILTIAKKYMNPQYKTISVVNEIKTADNIEQNYYVVNDKTRLEVMCRIMDYYNPNRAIVFCRTKRNADEVLERLTHKGYNAEVIHGDITQAQRISTLDKFKAGVFNYLIATDVAARGIHVEDVELVINYNIPESNEAYVHRIGRTGRANKSGIAVTFVRDREEKMIKELEKHINTNISKKSVPTREEILPNRVNHIIEQIEALSDENGKMFNEYVDNLSLEELKNITKKILGKELTKTIGTNFSIDVSTKKKKTKLKDRVLDDSIRVFVTIGKLDKIEKREFLNFIEKTANVPMNTCTGVEIMTKFTFMNVQKKYFKQVINKCNNIRYNNRLIRIEEAKK